MWMPVSISALLLALIAMMTAGIHEVDSFCVLGTLKQVLFPQRLHSKAHSVCWGPVWLPTWLCLWHFSFNFASAVCSVSFTSGDILLGKEECSPLNLEHFFGPLEGDHLLKQVMSISYGLKITSLKLILLKLCRSCGTARSERNERFKTAILQKVEQARLLISFMQQHSFCWGYAVYIYWKSSGSSWLALAGCCPLQSFPLAIWQNFRLFKILVLM